MYYAHISFFMFLTIATAFSQVQISSEKLFKASEPSVAFIGNDEGYGTGVVISKDGLILTNFHVVCTALPISVKVKVHTPAGPVEKEFKNVEIQKVHEKYDLAILKINDKSQQFYALNVNKITKVNTGSQCYVIGNPIVGDKHLRNTITSGLISSSEREFEENTYIQISAAVNPGNSGGPLFDSQGKYVGVVTFKVIESEGIGFAIPLSNVHSKDFVLLKEKKGNLEKGKEYEKKGSEFFKKSKFMRNEKAKALCLNMAKYFYKMSMFEMPNASSPYNNIALMYYNLGQTAEAVAYYKKCLFINISPEACHMMGIIFEKEKDEETALRYWLKGAFAKGQSGPCSENASLLLLKKKKYVEAVYLSRKSIVEENNYRRGQKSQTFATASRYLAASILAKIVQKTKTEEFSLKEMNQLASINNEAKVIDKKMEQVRKVKEAEEIDLFNNINNLEVDTETPKKKEGGKSEKKKESDESSCIDIFNEVINGK